MTSEVSQLSVLQLRDIHGLDPVSWWPPAPGWWLVLLLCIGLMYLLFLLVRDLQHYPAGSWNRDARNRLRNLQTRAATLSAAELASELSELLRRIAIARVGREAAAGLSGDAWLEWLEQHDPAGFQWSQRGAPLTELPYAPPSLQARGKEQLLALIEATWPWTDTQRGKSGA